MISRVWVRVSNQNRKLSDQVFTEVYGSGMNMVVVVMMVVVVGGWGAVADVLLTSSSACLALL